MLMTTSDYKKVILDNIYIVKAIRESFRTGKGSEIIFEGPKILDQISHWEELDSHYIKNSFINFRLPISSINPLFVKLTISDGSTHSIALTDDSLGSLITESTIKEGLITSECCFIPTFNLHNSSSKKRSSTLVVKGGKKYKEFINSIKSSELVTEVNLKLSDLHTGRFYKLSNRSLPSLFIGTSIETNPSRLHYNRIKSTKVKIFLQSQNLQFYNSLKDIVDSGDSVGLKKLINTQNIRFIKDFRFLISSTASIKTSDLKSIPNKKDPNLVELIRNNNFLKPINDYLGRYKSIYEKHCFFDTIKSFDKFIEYNNKNSYESRTNYLTTGRANSILNNYQAFNTKNKKELITYLS